MGYDYEITYKKGKDNIVVDSLSHTFNDCISLFSYFYAYSKFVAICLTKVISMALHYLKSSNGWPITILLYNINLGMVLL